MFSDNLDEDLDVLTYIHDEIIEASGGAKGFHDKGLILSALARPQQSVMGEDAYTNVYTKAAALLDSIANNHGFRDGNKRTAMAAASYFLNDNDIDVVFTNQEYEDFMLHVVNDKPNVDEIGTWLDDHSTQIPPTRWQLVNAQEQNREHPDTFHIPAAEEINSLGLGSSVKLGFEVDGDDGAISERMWVVVTARENNTFTGELDNDPATIRGISYKDSIQFDAMNIIGIWHPEE